MPLQLPVLDDRNFEQLLDEAKRRIPVHTPEWTNFDVESDPGITLVELFAFLTDSLLYRANRIPERNRLKFLQLLGIPMQAPAAAQGIITIRNERGPLAALPLNRGVVVSAGNVNYLTRDGVTVLPVEAQVYYKLNIPDTDPRYESLAARYEAVQVALAAAEEADPGAEGDDEPEEASGSLVKLAFYETTLMPAPTPSNPNPVVDMVSDTIDRAIYIALLAPQNVSPADAREALANQVLSIGVVPALADVVPPLQPHRFGARRAPVPSLEYELAAGPPDATTARYTGLRLVQAPDVLNEVGIVQVQLPGSAELQTWIFDDPLQEGLDDFPPKIDDPQVRDRLVTWLRLRFPTNTGQTDASKSQTARLTWVGINATRITQAVPVFNEYLGVANGEPDQAFTLASTPVVPGSLRLEVENASGAGQLWRLTDDLLSAHPDDPVFALDPEAGVVRFGDGLRGLRPLAGRRIRASYEYGGDVQGNVSIGAVKSSPDTRLQGGFKIENPLPTWGGDTGETVAEAERRIPLQLRHRDRLVTDQDFRDVTIRTPGVDMGRVEVLSLFKPDTPGDAAPGVVTVMVVPRFDAVRPRWPMPDRLFLRAVCDHLEPRRLVTTEIYARGPVYRAVYVSVGLEVRAGHFQDVVCSNARDRLYEYLSALPPGGPDGEGWPLSKRLLKKDLEAVLTRMPGVEFVNSMQMGVETSGDVDDYQFTGLELPLLAAVRVVEGPAGPLAELVAGGAPGTPPGAKIVPVPVTRAKC